MHNRWLGGFFTSVSMYSILPTPKTEWNDETAALLIPCFPLVGALIGGVWYGAAVLLSLAAIPVGLKAAALALLPLALSGFLHLDGYMDTSDAILSRKPLEEKRRILKDSHVGAFGAVMLGVCLLVNYASCEAVAAMERAPLALLFIPILSRCICGLLVLTVKPMTDQGYVVYYQQHVKPVHLVWLALLAAACLVGAYFAAGPGALLVLGVLAATALLTAWMTCKQLGGISGDLSGCALTVCEACALVALAIVR